MDLFHKVTSCLPMVSRIENMDLLNKLNDISGFGGKSWELMKILRRFPSLELVMKVWSSVRDMLLLE